MIGSLYTKSSFSMLESTLKPEVLFSNAKKYGYEFLAISDNKNLHGLYQFLTLAKEYKINTILGVSFEIYLDNEKVELLAYARNDKELISLIKLSTNLLTTETTNLEFLNSDYNDLIFVIPNNQKIFENIENENDYLKGVLFKLKNNLKNVYMGLSLQSDYLLLAAPTTVKLAKEYNMDLLPVRKTQYLNRDEHKTYEMLRRVENNEIVIPDDDLSFISSKELSEEFKQYPIVFNNLKKIFGNTSYNFLNKTNDLPLYPIKEDVTSAEYLQALSNLGLNKRLKNQNIDYSKYQERLNHELAVIDKMGYSDYFLIVYDFVYYAKTNDILVGPGRGSAAGSLVAYTLGITEVDPIKYDLLFERFLNIERRSMPDIDLDFPDNKRDLVIDYVKNKYGKTHVISISTFSTFQSRSAIRDIARNMKLTTTRTTAIINSLEKNKLDETDFEAMSVVRIAKTLEGLPRQTGTHPAGIILSKDDLTNSIPLQSGPHDMYQSQLEASDLENMGFLKIDFLGLKNLSIIEDVIAREGNKINLSKIPLNDQATYDSLHSGETTGIFQLESSGMRNVVRKMKPNKFEDIVALLALYRPGPMQFIDNYIERLHGATYKLVDSSIDEILKPTFGIIVYQEQIMRIATDFAGYTLSEADLLRRGISKKDKHVLESEQIRFVDRSLKMGRDKTIALKIYEYILEFADYGFNRSHSVAYGLIAYQMAYLKTHYYQSFMASLISNVQSSHMLVSEYVNLVRHNNIKVLRPNINESTDVFLSTKEGLLPSLLIIKGLGVQSVKKLLEERSNSKFKNFLDFKIRMKGIINEKNLRSLIHSGALDIFNITHASMLASSDLKQVGFESFLDDFQEEELAEIPFEELEFNENEVLGFNLYYLDDELIFNLEKLNNIKPYDPALNRIRSIVKLTKLNEITTKNNHKMAFADLNYKEYKLNGIIFPNAYNESIKQLIGKYIIINARKDDKGYIIDKIEKAKEEKNA